MAKRDRVAALLRKEAKSAVKRADNRCRKGIEGKQATSSLPIRSDFARTARRPVARGQLNHGVVWRNLKAMDVQLTPDQKAFARRAIESGRFHREEDAVQEALALWEERERQRAEFLLTLDDARASLARGEGRAITQESMQQLASEVKERGRARLLAELTTPL
jgi:Arc/MetJ-type ribon-helix-helix transcriptional regulator